PRAIVDSTPERSADGGRRETLDPAGPADLGQGPRPIKMVFIRAPRIRRFGPGVTPLVHHIGECVMARQGHILVAAFHPELTDDTAVHTYFADMVRGASTR